MTQHSDVQLAGDVPDELHEELFLRHSPQVLQVLLHARPPSAIAVQVLPEDHAGDGVAAHLGEGRVLGDGVALLGAVDAAAAAVVVVDRGAGERVARGDIAATAGAEVAVV